LAPPVRNLLLFSIATACQTIRRSPGSRLRINIGSQGRQRQCF